MTDLRALFEPRAVAVLGASRNPAKLGYRLLQNIREGGYGGGVHPVNPSGEPILGAPTVRSVDALPEAVDLALVSLPAGAVPEALARLAVRRVRMAVVLSSGFGEVDADGRVMQAELLTAARAAGLRLIGPNCMGVYSAPARLNGTYFWDLPSVPGGISMISQSGAYGGLIFRHLGARGLGIARFLSIGNQADLDIAEVLAYLGADPATTLIACFVEALRDGRRFVEVAQRVTTQKPIVVLKGGRSDAGRRAAGSHTGSLAGTYEVYRAAFRHAGVVLAEETDEFLDAIETLSVAGARRPSAPRVAILTVSGGPSVVAADAAERAGLTVPALPTETRDVLRALLPPFAAVGNPVDLTPQVAPDRIAPAIGRVLEDETIAGAVVVNVGLDFPEFAEAVVEASSVTGKPAVGFVADAPGIATQLRAGGVPVLPSPERAVRAWRALWAARPRTLSAPRPRLRLPSELSGMLATAHGALPYAVARRVLEAAGVGFCRDSVAVGIDEAERAAEAMGLPVVVKAEIDATHKSDVGAVRVGLRDRGAVRAVCEELAARHGVRRFIVQEQVGPGVELLVGARRDESFGPVVAVGSGGILTEVFRDVSFRLVPLDEEEALAMVLEGVRTRLLAGPRGLPATSPHSIASIAIAVADLMLAEPRIVEIDLNPVIGDGESAVAVDALVIIEGGEIHSSSAKESQT